MALGTAMTDANFDAQTDDPKQAFTELSDNVGFFNAFRLLVLECGGATAGDGLEISGTELQLDLASDSGLEINTNEARIKLITASGLQRVASGLGIDLNSLTTATPDTAADYLMWLDATDSTLKKSLLSTISSIAAGSIGQTEIGASAVGQGELKSTTGDITRGNGGYTLSTGPGGQYGFWPTIKTGVSASGHFNVSPVTDHYVSAGSYYGSPESRPLGSTLGTTSLQRFQLNNTTQYGGTNPGTLTVTQRYMQSSPPYDMGDGQVHGFIYALIDNNTSGIISMWQAADPPWANNGKTDIASVFTDKKGVNHRKFQQMKRMKDLTSVQKKDYLMGNFDMKIGKERMIPITNEFKNSDMEEVPNPYTGHDSAKESVVLLDPMSTLVERVMLAKSDGESTILDDVFHKEFAVIDNVVMSKRKGPKSLDIHGVKFK